MPDVTPQAPPAFHLLAKPTGAVCNLDCKYCFFLSKDRLYPGSDFRMSDAVLERYIQQLLESHRTPEVTVAWQGGEPTLMGLDFFERSIEYVDKHRRPGQQVMYTLQTNGTRLDDAWCEFFKKHGFLIGLSVDGPRELHDAYRVNKGGAGTFDQVMRGAALLKKHGVDFNVLCTVHAANADHPLEVYRFFRDELGARHLQFIPIVERVTEQLLPVANQGWGERPGGERPLYTQAGNRVTDRSVKPEQYGRFLCILFEEWVRRDIGTVYVQMFDATLGAYVGQYSLCIFSPTCGNALALEHNGDLYACDHYVEPDYLLGNIQEKSLVEMVASDKQRRFGGDKQETLPRYCRECPVRFACNGGCPRERFLTTPGGEPGLNYLCAGYKLFFTHVDRPMRLMAGLLERDRAPSELMRLYAQEDAERSREAFSKAGRNDPCPCGSGSKFKRCHG
ncbi:anaerobic sulfatase maturase [Cystobacter ferrugineus]|uniref:Anaerobic sulfatase maturase n=1 Tax=Cystobacter ferrugineus TaxID=83449 RepID=A0A1L9AUI7_9BACT|nr:anaerobic sulfatase maturase [Cystobacter ferrugineus]OJH33669.1 anaerobic sulfatase maturase [Cystobacter ferrugineus]